MTIAACSADFKERRRHFWTTQPSACGSIANSCGDDCGRPGLLFSENENGQKSFVTTDWMRSLVINILMTDGKLPNRACGYDAWGQGGHWSESYRGDGQKIGTLVRELPTERSIKDSISTVKAKLENDLSRLIAMKIANSVLVETNYLGQNRVGVSITVTSIDGVVSKVGITGVRSSASWLWN